MARSRARRAFRGVVRQCQPAREYLWYDLERVGTEGLVRSPSEISRLFDYNRWANARTLEASAALAPEEYRRVLGGSFPSVAETLAHIYAAEWIWLERWCGRD